MLDLHSHVLPFIDDGSRNIEMSLGMLEEAKRQGVEILAATPHCVTDKEDGVSAFVEKRSECFELLKEAMKDNPEKYPKLVLGAEVYLGCDISEFDNLHDLCYQGSDYILLELSGGYDAAQIAEWVYNIKIKNIFPVIAHVDRYKAYKEIMYELSPLNVVYQINASQFQTMAGRSLLKHIFKRHDKFLVSTDMHNLTSRPCNIAKSAEIAKKKYSKMYDMLFEKGAKCIVENRKFIM